MDADTLDMLTTSLTRVLSEDTGVDLAARLDQLGWDDAVADDAPTAYRTLFSVKGATVSGADALGPFLSARLAAALGIAELTQARVALPSTLHAERFSCRRARGGLSGTAVVTGPPSVDRPVVVAVPAAGGVSLARIDPRGEMSAVPVAGMDRLMGLFSITIDATRDELTWFEGSPARSAWQEVVTAGRWAVAAELVGVTNSVVRQAVAYTSERVQYGQPIGTFQALQHRLADAHAGAVGAGDLVEEASTTGDSWAAKVAKAYAGRAGELACTHAQQAYGAIGFTWEHEFHHSLRRVYTLDRILGDYRTLEFELGAELQATGHVPLIGRL